MTRRRRNPVLRRFLRLARVVVLPIRAAVARNNRASQPAQRVLDRFPSLQAAFMALIQGDSQHRYEKWVAAYDTLDSRDVGAIQREQASFDPAPTVTVIALVAGASEHILDRFVEAMQAQLYPRWKLHFVGAAARDDDVEKALKRAAAADPRIEAVAAPEADLWETLRSADGEFVVIADPHVNPRPHALFLFVRTIVQEPDVQLVYGDEDAIDQGGIRFAHYFKPDWNKTLLASQNYLGGFVCLRRSLLSGTPRALVGHDLNWSLLRSATTDVAPERVRHLAFVLSHRRSRSHDAESRERIARALEEEVADAGRISEVVPVGEFSYRTRRTAGRDLPTVSIIVPTTCELETLRPCLEGLLLRTSYPSLEIVVVANALRRNVTENHAYLEDLTRRPNVRVVFYEDGAFNFSKLNNWAVRRARSDFLCFLNDDTEVMDEDWLRAMVRHILEPDVAAVGAMLYYPNDTIQHAGVVLGVSGVAGHPYSRQPKGIYGYNDRATVEQDVSCVTAACMLVRRDAFLAVGGFDEALAIAYNDVELCLKLRGAGWRIVWTPNAELYHRESASTGPHDAGGRRDEWIAEGDLMRRRWVHQLTSDPHYNPNLSLQAIHLWEPAFPPRVAYPWRTASEPLELARDTPTRANRLGSRLMALRRAFGQTRGARVVSRWRRARLTIPRVLPSNPELLGDTEDARVLAEALARSGHADGASRTSGRRPRAREVEDEIRNVLLVSHCDFTGNSAVHVYRIANELNSRGFSPVIAVPGDPRTVADVGQPRFPVISYRDALVGGLVFPDGGGPDLVHAFTARERVRKFTVRIMASSRCPYVVHLEDNDRAVLAAELEARIEDIEQLPAPLVDRFISAAQTHPLRGPHFVRNASGVSVVIGRLLELAPPHVASAVVRPGFDEAVLSPVQSRESVRDQLGIRPEDYAVVYTGNIHPANVPDMRRLYVALAALQRDGYPIVFVKTGWNSSAAPELQQLGNGLRDLGWVPRAMLPGLLAAADVLVQPGIPGPFNDFRFPAKLPDFLASGKPVVLSRTNIGTVLEDGREALVVEHGASEEIYRAIKLLREKPDLGPRIGEQGRAFALRELRWATSVDEVEALYGAVSEPPPPSALELPPPVKLIALVREAPSARDVEIARRHGIYGFSAWSEGIATLPFSEHSDYETSLRRLVLRAMGRTGAEEPVVVVDPGGALTSDQFLKKTRTAARDGIRAYYASRGLDLRRRTVEDMLRLG